MCQTRFVDGAPNSIQSQESINAPFTGRFSPDQPLGGFTGAQGNGTWKFHVSDNAGSDTGKVHAFTVKVAGYAS